MKGKLHRARLATLLLGLVFLALSASPVASDVGSPPVQGPPPLIEANGDELAVGDLVAQGVRLTDGACEFGGFKVRTTAPGSGRTRWLAILLNPECRAVVNAKWEGSLTEGPRHVIEPLLRVLPSASLSVPEEPQLGLMSEADSSDLSVTATKTSEQLVFM